MTDKRFVWLLGSGEARNGRKLETGETYRSEDFPEGVVAEWVRSGAAKYEKPGKEKPAQEE